MYSIIVIENGANESSIDQTIAAATQVAKSNVSYVGAAAPKQFPNNMFPIADGRARAIQEAIRQSKGERVILVDARLGISAEDLSAFLKFSEKERHQVAYATLSVSGNIYEFPDVSTEELISQISQDSSWPLALISINRASMNRAEIFQGDKEHEILMNMVMACISDGEGVARFSKSFSHDIATRFELTSRARILKAVLASFNIEDLFPQHAWKGFEQESAAAAYHSLAATFIKLNDLGSAAECLALSDQLEDSPRSLALKGLIANIKGETLGAVANMVSSLQQYEKRKHKDAGHYLSFTPNNLEMINTNLNAGLQALNAKDNGTALEHFATAVFSFDEFYGQHGVNSLKDIN